MQPSSLLVAFRAVQSPILGGCASQDAPFEAIAFESGFDVFLCVLGIFFGYLFWLFITFSLLFLIFKQHLVAPGRTQYTRPRHAGGCTSRPPKGGSAGPGGHPGDTQR